MNNIIKALAAAAIEYLIYVPATGMTHIYESFEKSNRAINVCREEEGVAVAAGIALGGKLSLLLIQQSGVGNMLNCFIGLAEAYQIYFPIIVLDRGIHDENPVQAFSSLKTIPIIETFDKPVHLDLSHKDSIIIFKDLVVKRNRWFISSY